ncbi:MAG: hypothetical protein DHS20C01_33530 [marine bacterium B5-7]|nr:MAG: hypothetical protein DHS20C01_33530 [marine bacterium B5-7]
MANKPEHDDTICERLLSVDADTDIEELVSASNDVDRILIHVPVFTDGRIFSLVRRLQEHRDFTGKIAVRGDMLPDQVTLLHRLGVTEICLDNGLDINDQPREITRSYRERRIDVVLQNNHDQRQVNQEAGR